MDTKKPIIYEFNGNQIEFLLNDDRNVKVNATQMAKVFDKRVNNFLQNKETKNFIETLLSTLIPVNKIEIIRDDIVQ